MSRLCDWQIAELCEPGRLPVGEKPMLEPFVSSSITEGGVSYGLSSVGYDVRLGAQFKCGKGCLLRGNAGRHHVIAPPPLTPAEILEQEAAGTLVVLDPRKRAEGNAHFEDFEADEVVLHPGAFLLAHTMEYFWMPSDVDGEAKDKSSWARWHIALQNTILEPEWNGILTLEISNHGPFPVCLPVGAAISQIVFKRGASPRETYADRNGKYMGQRGVNLPR